MSVLFVRLETTTEKCQKFFIKFLCFKFHERWVTDFLAATRIQTDGWTETFDRRICMRVHVPGTKTKLCTKFSTHKKINTITITIAIGLWNYKIVSRSSDRSSVV
jgi:hypothetical protein